MANISKTLTILVLALYICGGVEGIQKRESQKRGATVVTFNTAGTPRVKLYEERKVKMAAAIASLGADIICLQEVLYEDDIRSIMRELGDEYPYSFSFLHKSKHTKQELAISENTQSGERPCKGKSFDAFKQCYQFCSSVSNVYSSIRCTFDMCRTETLALEQDCLSCFVFSATSLSDVVAKCATPSTSGRNRFNAQGLLLLSKEDFDSEQAIAFNADHKQVVQRGALKVTFPRIGTLGCTHLSSSLEGIPYFDIEKVLETNLNITSFEQLQKKEIAILAGSIPEGPTIIAGALNTGPAVPEENVYAQLQEYYAALTNQGFESPYVKNDGRCTYCNENPLIMFSPNQIYDHVLLRGIHAEKAIRVLDGPGVIRRPGLRPSNHYGVSVTLVDSN